MHRSRLGLVAGITAFITSAGLVGAPSALSAEDVVRAATSYAAADRALAGEVLLWVPSYTAGLRRTREIDVVAYPLEKSRATFVGSTYGKRIPSFTVAQKGSANSWAARPVEHPSERLVETISIRIGPAGAKRLTRARIYANCAGGDTAPGSTGSTSRRCERRDVARFGGAVVLLARTTARGTPTATDVRIDSTGLSYRQLVRVARGLQPVE